MHILSLLIGWVPVAHAQSNPTLNKWGNAAPGVQQMWDAIGNTVYTVLPAGASSDVVGALTWNIVEVLFSLIAGAAVLLIMYAGIRMIVARGKDDEFTQGKTIITWAIIGLVLSLLANVIITFFETGFLPTFLQ